MNATGYLESFAGEYLKGGDMEIAGLVEDGVAFGDYPKQEVNTVQEILKESEADEDICGRSGTILRSVTGTLISDLTDNLVLCAASLVNPGLLDSLNITCVVNAAPELPDAPIHRDDVVYLKIPIVDAAASRISAYFDEAADLIQQVANSGGKTLVFCVAGVSRSASLCLAYLMKHHRLSLLDAYNYVKLRRPRIRPNCGFFRQLIDYEQDIFGCNTVKMIYNDLVRMEIPDVYDCEYRFVGRLNDKRRNQNGRY